MARTFHFHLTRASLTENHLNFTQFRFDATIKVTFLCSSSTLSNWNKDVSCGSQYRRYTLETLLCEIRGWNLQQQILPPTLLQKFHTSMVNYCFPVETMIWHCKLSQNLIKLPIKWHRVPRRTRLCSQPNTRSFQLLWPPLEKAPYFGHN